MRARRMAANDEVPSEFLVKQERGVSHVGNDVRDNDLRAEPITGNGYRIAVSVQPRCPMAERGGVERAPVSAVHDDDDGAVVGRLIGMKEVDRLASVIAVAEAELGMPGAIGAVDGRIAFPTGYDFRMLGNARAVVVLRLIVQRRQA